jgi:hypothetical protein
MHRKRIGQINQKVINFDLFFGRDRDLAPPPGTLAGVLQSACACNFCGVTFQVDLTNCQLYSDLKRGRRRG